MQKITNAELKIYLKQQIEYCNDNINHPVQMFPDDESFNNYIDRILAKKDAYEEILAKLGE